MGAWSLSGAVHKRNTAAGQPRPASIQKFKKMNSLVNEWKRLQLHTYRPDLLQPRRIRYSSIFGSRCDCECTNCMLAKQDPFPDRDIYLNANKQLLEMLDVAAKLDTLTAWIARWCDYAWIRSREITTTIAWKRNARNAPTISNSIQASK